MRRRPVIAVVGSLAAVACVAYLATGAFIRGRSSDTLRRAALALQTGDPDQARATLRWLLWFEPEHPAARRLIGLSYLRESNPRAAIEHLAQVPEDSGLHREAQLDLAASLLVDRQWQRAEAVLRKHLARYPDSLVAVRQLSGLLLAELRRREAIEVLESFLHRSTGPPPAPAGSTLAPHDRLLILRDLATAEFHPPSAEACLPALNEALQRDPGQADVRLALGRCHHATGDLPAAEPLLREALASRPDHGPTRRAVSEWLLDQGRTDEAAALLPAPAETGAGGSSGLSDLPDEEDQFAALRSRVAELRGDFEHALELLERAIARRPSDREYEARRARLLQRLNRIEAAQAAYARSHELGQAELELWNLSRDLGVRPPTAADCERVAQLYERLGRTLQAEAWRRLDPESVSGTAGTSRDRTVHDQE